MLVLHSVPDTATTIVRLVALAAQVPLEIRALDRSGDILSGAEYRGLNPTGTIPVLETPHGPVSETGAVLLWLADSFGLGPKPPDAERPAFLKWLFFLSNTLHADLRQLIRPWRYAPAESEAGHITLAAGRFLTGLGQLDSAFHTEPRLFPPLGPLSGYAMMLVRWAAQYPQGHTPWFHLAAFPALHHHARAAEAMAPARTISSDEGMGPHPFSDPPPARPPGR